MKKNNKKKRKIYLVLINIILLTLVILICFSFFKVFVNKELKNYQLKKIYLLEGDRKDIYFFENEFIESEDLEKIFKIYSKFEINKNKFIVVKNDSKYDFNLVDGNIVLVDVNVITDNNICDYIIKDDKLYLNLKKISKYFGYNFLELKNIKVPDEFSDDSAMNLISEEKINLKEFNLEYLSESKENIEDINLKLKKNSYILAWDLYGNNSKQIVDKAVDVVMPTWLKLNKDSNDIIKIYRPEYVKNLKNQDKDIWIVINNQFDKDITSKMLNDYTLRTNTIKQIMSYLLENNISGLNLDFENMYLSDSDSYVQFVAELNYEMQKYNKILSVCVTVAGGSDTWSKVYDRKRLSEVSNFLTLMAYDQHYASSQIIGPVAGYKWVDTHLESMVEYVPSKKIILGVPFYTRLWYERLSSDKVNSNNIKSRSLYMKSIDSVIEKNNPIKVWDEENKQYYYAYYSPADSSYIKFWYDDGEAIYEKSKLVNKYNLSGISAWALGYEKPDVWRKIEKIR